MYKTSDVLQERDTQGWKPIEGTDRRYLAHPSGAIKSSIYGKVLTPYDNGKGVAQVNYQIISSRGEWKRKAYSVKKIIMQTFRPDEPVGNSIINKDGNPFNNAVENLEWVYGGRPRVNGRWTKVGRR